MPNIFKTGIRIADLSNENDIRNGGISNSGIEGTFPIQTYRNYQQQETVGEGTVTTPISCFQRTLGERIYECSDHLGNVRVVIGDKRLIEEETIAYENDFSTPLGSEIVANEAGTFQLANDQLEVTTTAINDGITFNITGLEDHQEYVLTYELDETGMDVTGLNSLGELVDANQGLNTYIFTSNGQSITFEFISATGAGVFLMDNVKLATPELAKAEMMAYNDYYPFGMLQPGRNQQSDAYRYGFNGMEKDDEVKGSGNSYTAEFWQYDSRLGRRWNMDPVVKTFRSSYDAFSNNPIIRIDPNGDDDVFDLEGNFLRSTASGTEIKIQLSDNETVLLSEVRWETVLVKDENGEIRNFGNASSNAIISEIVKYNSPVTADIILEKDRNFLAASYVGSNTIGIGLNKAGSIRSLLNDYHNLGNEVKNGW